jgi:predicted O-linked N-acetylglucosamine transferase (SPINDLY family)
MGWFALPLVEGANPQDLRLILYSDRRTEDAVTERLRAGAAAFRRITDREDHQVAEQIAADGVDVLIDMSGHTGGNRLGLFAGRAAPLQASWAAYVGTTGVSAMDLLIADALQIPPEDEAFYSEQIVRLPVGYVPYAPPPYAPEVAPLPDPAQGLVLGCFNNPAKYSNSCLTLWAQTLAALPQARLLVKFRYLDEAATAQHLRNRFIALGGDGGRLDIEGGSPHAEMLAAYSRVHLALDSSPYSGGLTTLEALWMGVPVLTLPGRTFASRHSLTHLSHLGLGALCAQSAEDFVSKATALANDPARLTAYRQTLRPTMAASTTCDGATFARHLSKALRQAWAQAVP